MPNAIAGLQSNKALAGTSRAVLVYTL